MLCFDNMASRLAALQHVPSHAFDILLQWHSVALMDPSALSDSPEILMIDSGNKVSDGKTKSTAASHDTSLFEDASSIRQSWDGTLSQKVVSDRPKSQRGTSLGTSAPERTWQQATDKGPN